MAACAVIITFVILSALQAANAVFYIQMSPGLSVRWNEGRRLCEDHGMSLPILPTQADLDHFMDVISVMAGSQGTDIQAWLGLQHDGSNMTSPDHFTWIDGQQATYVHGQSMDTNGTVSDTCVRLNNDHMKLTPCSWKRTLFCQGNVASQSDTSPLFYSLHNRISDESQTTIQFHLTRDLSELPTSLNMRSVGDSVRDMTDCFQWCAVLPGCSLVAMLHDRSSCFVQV